MLYVYFVKKNNDVEGKNATKKVSSVTFKILHQFFSYCFYYKHKQTHNI